MSKFSRVAGMDVATDQRLRASAFSFLDQLEKNGTPLVRQEDLAPFSFDGAPVRMMATQQGIWKPKFLDAALSIRTVFSPDPSKRPYDDEPGSDGFLRYKWRGTDFNHFDNRSLRRAMVEGVPLIWFHGVAQALYLPIFPVYLAAEEPQAHQFVVSLDAQSLKTRMDLELSDPPLLRSYAERVVRERLHQPLFRQRVLVAYKNQCAICHLRHTQLLDAAHVLPDAEGGEPVVTNGIAMCKIHHAAYDADIFGISPSYKVGVRPDIMKESDGPTLRHTLQAIDGSPIDLPGQRSARPDPDLLQVRWDRFREAC
jgi:putative restriction endonuclease